MIDQPENKQVLLAFRDCLSFSLQNSLRPLISNYHLRHTERYALGSSHIESVRIAIVSSAGRHDYFNIWLYDQDFSLTIGDYPSHLHHIWRIVYRKLYSQHSYDCSITTRYDYNDPSCIDQIIEQIRLYMALIEDGLSLRNQYYAKYDGLIEDHVYEEIYDILRDRYKL